MNGVQKEFLDGFENENVGSAEAAKILGVSTIQLRKLTKLGKVTPSKSSTGRLLFSTKELNDLVANSENSDSDGGCSGLIEQQSVNPRNLLNDLTGGEWLPETKSFFYQKGLGSKHPHAQIERQHPAPFSFQDVSHLITFFTKKGMHVLDPFGGVGSTAKACALEGRVCTSIELQDKWHSLAQERLDVEIAPGTSKKHIFIQGDTRIVLQGLETESVDFVITSPPYWSILNKKADHKVKKERIANDLATNYSDNDEADLANISSYSDFLDVLVSDVFLQCARVLKKKKYMALVVSDFRHKSDFISFHSDLIQRLNKAETPDKAHMHLQGVKVLLQNHKTLLPYGYPFAYVENIHHQYVLIFRKDK